MIRTIFGRQHVLPFISVWDTTKTGVSASNQIKLPLVSGFPYKVDWGDGVTNIINSTSDSNLTHTYSVSGIYTVKILNVVRGFAFANGGDRLKLKEILNWGNFTFNVNAFQGCSNLTLLNVIGIPNIVNTISCFSGCTSITKINNIQYWKTSGLTDFRLAFFNCTNFNDSNISNWNVSNGIFFNQMFLNCSFFNQKLNWDFSKATQMTGFLQGAVRFNQDVSNWNISNSTNDSDIFNGATAFMQPISMWNFNKNTLLTNLMLNKYNYPPNLMDDVLIKIESCVVGTGRTQTNKNLQFGGSRTSASDAAVASLKANGWSGFL